MWVGSSLGPGGKPPVQGLMLHFAAMALVNQLLLWTYCHSSFKIRMYIPTNKLLLPLLVCSQRIRNSMWEDLASSLHRDRQKWRRIDILVTLTHLLSTLFNVSFFGKLLLPLSNHMWSLSRGCVSLALFLWKDVCVAKATSILLHS